VTLDIDGALDVVHGGQQLSFWTGLDGERVAAGKCGRGLCATHTSLR